jgi:hypothetical protein
MRVYEGVIPLRVRFAVDDGADPVEALLSEATNIQDDWNDDAPRDEVSGKIDQQEAYDSSFALVVGWDKPKPPVQLQRWRVRLNRWNDDIEDDVFYSREEAVAVVKALLKQMGEQPGGWRSCPPSHAGGCKWRKLSRAECDQMGWGWTGATDVWGHRRTGDKYHTERISIYQEDS